MRCASFIGISRARIVRAIAAAPSYVWTGDWEGWCTGLVRLSGEVVVADFGLARVLEGEVMPTATAAPMPTTGKGPFCVCYYCLPVRLIDTRCNSARLATFHHGLGQPGRQRSSCLAGPHHDRGRHAVYVVPSAVWCATPFDWDCFPLADFMAPELFLGKDYNEAVDVFSFGALAAPADFFMIPQPNSRWARQQASSCAKSSRAWRRTPTLCPGPTISALMRRSSGAWW